MCRYRRYPYNYKKSESLKYGSTLGDKYNLGKNTIEEIKQISDLTTLDKWKECLEGKIEKIDYNINNVLKKYIENKTANTTCNYTCSNIPEDYDGWYTSKSYEKANKSDTTPTLPNEVEQCKLKDFECEGIKDFVKGKNFTTIKEAQDACKQAQEEAEKLKKEADKTNERQKAKATIINMYDTMCDTIYKSLGTKLENKETNGTGTTTKGRVNNSSTSTAVTANTTKYESKHNKDVLEYAKAITIYSCTPKEKNDNEIKNHLKNVLKDKNNGQCHAISGGEGDSVKKVLDNIFEGYLKKKNLTYTGTVCQMAKRIAENE
ncbi:MAG: hypothetical protein K2M23_02975 [Alphaproteobacteria bacterium]|nr:hypothetical protein [Alphaproteobacteria bacterium]